MPAKVELKEVTHTVWDARFELAALKGMATLQGLPDNRFDRVMMLAVEILTWTPGPEVTDAKAAVMAHTEEVITEFVLIEGNDIKSAAAELLILGAAMSSLLRKWHVEAHPDTAKQPEVTVEPITWEEFEELKAQGVKTAKAEDLPMDEAEEPGTEYTPKGDEGWIGGGEDRDVV